GVARVPNHDPGGDTLRRSRGVGTRPLWVVPASYSRGASGGTISGNDSGHFSGGNKHVLTHTRRSRVARFWAALAALVVVPATLAVSASSAGAAGSNTLTVKAGEYTYVLKGSPKAGWTQVNFDNAGVENHMIVGFHLKKGTTPGA